MFDCIDELLEWVDRDLERVWKERELRESYLESGKKGNKSPERKSTDYDTATEIYHRTSTSTEDENGKGESSGELQKRMQEALFPRDSKSKSNASFFRGSAIYRNWSFARFYKVGILIWVHCCMFFYYEFELNLIIF